MAGLRAIVMAAVPALDNAHVVIGPADGKLLPPYVVIRSTGGPEEMAQVPEAERRIDVNVYMPRRWEKPTIIASAIHAHLRRRAKWCYNRAA